MNVSIVGSVHRRQRLDGGSHGLIMKLPLGVCAAIVPRDPGGDARELEDRLHALAREQLAPHKRPTKIAVVRALPLGTSGKIDRRALAAYWAD